MQNNVKFVDFEQMHNEIREELDASYKSVINKNWFIKGNEFEQFNKEFAKYCSVNYCVGCGTGLDAIYLILRALNIGHGDEVIVPAHTFVATALAVSYTGATPVFVDIKRDTYTIDPEKCYDAINKKTKAIIAVHLYGQAADMDKLIQVAKENNLYLIEDCAQAHGSKYKNKSVGTFGIGGAFSFYPGKNLGALGDGGAVISNNQNLIEKVNTIANYGSNEKYNHTDLGINSRLDELQAGFLRVKLRKLDRWNENRRYIAERYLNNIVNPKIVLPYVAEYNEHVWHIFAIRTKFRDELQQYLKDNGVETLIHYPIPVHLQKAYRQLNYKRGDFPNAEEISSTILSIPMYYKLPQDKQDYVIELLNKY